MVFNGKTLECVSRLKFCHIRFLCHSGLSGIFPRLSFARAYIRKDSRRVPLAGMTYVGIFDSIAIIFMGEIENALDCKVGKMFIGE